MSSITEREQYHILNGDALKDQFPDKINGDIIIARECLVDGDVKGKNLNELFVSRANFLSKNYGGIIQDYYNDTVPEFQKMLKINDNSDINLWFGDDLFCQVNCWFVLNLLKKQISSCNFYLIKPDTHYCNGFSLWSESEFLSAFNNKLKLKRVARLSELWEYYQNNNIDLLIKISTDLKKLYPFIYKAVNAYIQTIPKNGNLGRPVESLTNIMIELNTKDFGQIFREFNKREEIYGFGDLQVKKIYNEIINSS